MKPSQAPTPAPVMPAVTSDILAHGGLQLAPGDFPRLRQRPGPGVGESLPGTFLKHADEQTVAGLAAVLETIHAAGWGDRSFAEWGVVAAPCFLGRATLASALERFAVEGAWGLSPHFIPHRSQHAVSGTISQALKIKGPNFGTGGGPSSLLDGFLAALVLLTGNRLPGVWLVFTAYEPEMIPQASGTATEVPTLHALALALGPSLVDWPGLRLRVLSSGSLDLDAPCEKVPQPTLPALKLLLAGLVEPAHSRTSVIWPVEGGTWIDLGRQSPRVAGSENANGNRNRFNRPQVERQKVPTEKTW